MELEIIKGGEHTDHRGTLQFINDFDMSLVKRFYAIKHSDTETRRGWRGHRIEQRWFHVVYGAFKIELVQIDNWDSPAKDLPVQSIILSGESNEVMHVPVGYATCLTALKADSKVILFADYGIDNAKLDDHLWPSDYFTGSI